MTDSLEGRAGGPTLPDLRLIDLMRGQADTATIQRIIADLGRMIARDPTDQICPRLLRHIERVQHETRAQYIRNISKAASDAAEWHERQAK